MYRAKRPGQSSVVMFNNDLARDTEGLFSSWVNSAVYDAVIHGSGLTMYYQPIADVEDARICHYEALARIERDGELIGPSKIFPIIEARSLEVEFDRAVMRAVLADLASGRVRPGTGVSVNLSGPTVVQEPVCQWLADFVPFLKDYRVMLEVTETALITQIGLANDHLRRLRDMGFEIALDDFGSGYSSLRYLANMPVDVVKFDISLIQGLRDPTQRRLIAHLAQMIRESGARLVAEGIEDMGLLGTVRALGFQFGQGRLIGLPDRRADSDHVVFDNVTPFPSDRRA
jgi:EAL domain-containing protein (putative c-di-GMP-specific phosphodiesterase class I)